MALDRKDVRAKLDANMHKALTVISQADQLDIGEWVERLIVGELRKRIHDAQSIADETKDLGITGNNRESSGVTRK